MSQIFAIARIYCIEVVRDRFFLALVLLAFFLFGMSLILGGMSFAEQNRILTHLGFSSIHLVTVGLATFLGAYSVSREIERRTFVVVLARPVSRLQFLIGKLLGLNFICFLAVAGFSVVLLVLLGSMENAGNLSRIAISMWAEAALLIAVASLWGVIMKPLLAVTCTLGIYLIGHWQGDLLFFARQSGSEAYENFAIVVSYITPNLEAVNFRAYNFLSDGVPLQAWSLGILHVLGWIAVLVFLAGITFRGRDLV